MVTAAQHRTVQARIGAVSVVRMRSIWRLLDPDDVDGTFGDWYARASQIVAAQRALSARSAVAYLTASKAARLGLATPLDAVIDDMPDPAALRTSLLVTGPLSLKRAMTRGVPINRAASVANAASAAAAMRHSLEGGRKTILATLRNDPDAQGWQRVASGNACSFCSTLDGKFHRSDDADFPAHDGCSCSQEPVWR